MTGDPGTTYYSLATVYACMKAGMGYTVCQYKRIGSALWLQDVLFQIGKFKIITDVEVSDVVKLVVTYFEGVRPFAQLRRGDKPVYRY
jgi:hypothetical protein